MQTKKPIQIKLLNTYVKVPSYATPGSAGLDLQAALKEAIEIYPGENIKVGTGIAVAIPEGYVGLVMPKSGKGSNGIGIKNLTGVIDSDYRGEIIVNVWNTNKDSFRNHENCIIRINPLEQIAQLLIMPVVQAQLMVVDEFTNSTLRGEGGFGSTDKPLIDPGKEKAAQEAEEKMGISGRPRLENWVCLYNQLIGNVYGDPRFADGQVIRTTPLLEIDSFGNYARTHNSEYILGKRAESRHHIGSKVHEESGDLPGVIKALRHCQLCEQLFSDSELNYMHNGYWCNSCLPEVL